MNIIIMGRRAGYIPDYTPVNPAWKIQLQDAHRLVVIAGIECFVKRFERLLPAWNFLVENRGVRHEGLPLIYDAQSQVENGRTVYYLFLEKIEGELLHDVIRTGRNANGSVLGRSMAAAFRVLKVQGYWHADFCTKNIMATVNKQFILIDLDSLEPASTLPNTIRNQPGYIPDQELAVYSLNYVRNYVQPAIKTFANLPGPALNVVQLIFLLDKLVYFAVVIKPAGERFGNKKNFEKLPEIVHNNLAAYTDKLVANILTDKSVTDEMILSQGRYFQKQLQDCPKSIPAVVPTVNKLKVSPALPLAPSVKPNLARLATPTVISPTVPLIVSFTASKRVLRVGDITTISWKVEGVAQVDISNIGTVNAEGSKVIKSGDFEGIRNFELIIKGSAIKKSIIITFPLSVGRSFANINAQSNAAYTPVTNKPIIAHSSKVYYNSVHARSIKLKSKHRKIKLFTICSAIAFVVMFISGMFSSNNKTIFIPDQQRGLKLFEQGKFDSSFINLVSFIGDTSYNFATQYNLAYMYDFGKGTKVNDALAVDLYYKSLSSKSSTVVSNSFYYLGMSYLLGEGCQLDIEQAKKCFTLAADGYGNQQARAELKKLKVSEEKDRVEQAPKHQSITSNSRPSIDVEYISQEPNVNSKSSFADGAFVKRVVQLSEYTRVDFIFTARTEEQDYVYLNPPGHNNAMYIRYSGTRYELKKTKGIANATDITYAEAGKPLYFSAYFEKIPSDASVIDILEGDEDTSNAWFFYGVNLKFEAQ